MIVTNKYRLYKSRRHNDLHGTTTLAGRAYNHAIALHKRYDKLTGKHLNPYALMKHLTRLKKRPHYAWLNDIPSQALQDVVPRIEKGYQLFFKSVRGQIKTKVRPPSFKKSRHYKSFTLKQAGYKFLEDKKPGAGRIRIGGKVYKFVKDRELVGPVKTVTLKRDKLGNFYVCIAQEVETPEFKPTTGQMAGFDFGLKTFLTVHDGIETYPIESPQFFKQALSQVRQANRALSRKQKGSHHRRQAKRHLAQVHQRVANRRQDWFFKLAHELTDRYDVLVFETLNLRGMKRIWGRKVSDLAFGTFLKILEHVACKKGKQVHDIDRFYPSSKTCSHCGHRYKDLKLSERWWRCPGCHKIVDRDGNAAVNIFREGASSLGRASVIPYSVRLPVLTPETNDFQSLE
jgi:putative transposase